MSLFGTAIVRRPWLHCLLIILVLWWGLCTPEVISPSDHPTALCTPLEGFFVAIGAGFGAWLLFTLARRNLWGSIAFHFRRRKTLPEKS